MCFERPAGSFRKNTKTRLCRFFVGERRAVKHIRTALRFQLYGRTRRSPCRRVAANKIRETVLPDGLRSFIIASPRYIQMLKRDASRQRPALPLPSLRLKEQRSRQPLGKTDGRRLSADSVRASVPPHSTGGKIPFRSFLHSLHARRRAAGHLVVHGVPDAGTRRHAAGCTVTTQAEAQGGPPLSPTALLWNPICLNTRSALRHTRPARG